MSKVCVLGAGSWGTALASVLDENGHEVLIWARRQDQVDEINNKNNTAEIFFILKLFFNNLANFQFLALSFIKFF